MRALLLVPALLAAAPLAAQSDVPPATRDSIVAVAKRLFDGMRAHDSTMVRSVFAPGAMLMGQIRPGQPITFTSADGFVAMVGRPGAPWDEQIYDPVVQADGDLATLWVFYTFSLGENFSHCGVDAFQLVRTAGGWKISMLADTRRKEGCETVGRGKV
jgi:hypothetical protein